MYIPAHFQADEDQTQAFLDRLTVADLVTATPQGIVATFLPVLRGPGPGPYGSLQGHVARNNPQWAAAPTGEALVIARGPDAYVSPGWYPSKQEHGRVVPTWNYALAHVYGQLVVHDDVTWVEEVVRRLTARHEASRPEPWTADDAPAHYLAGQLRAVVGVEVIVSRVEFKLKMSQNRPEADIDGVIEGLTAVGDRAAAEAVAGARPSTQAHAADREAASW